MRQFIRHPSDVPIDYELDQKLERTHDQLKNYSDGGVCFVAEEWIEPDTEIQVSITVAPPAFHAIGTVVWCKSIGGRFEVGVRFQGDETDYALRMIEQICHIEQYKKDVQENEGRRLSGEEAAMEWIERYASEFPR